MIHAIHMRDWLMNENLESCSAHCREKLIAG